MLLVTKSGPRAVSCTLRAISEVATSCSSMAVATDIEIWDISPIVPAIA
jgi:hypothetical protein